MSAEQILAALRQLDPANDNHWTADGSPRLDTVKLLAGGAALTRDQVTQAAPGYSRATAGAYWQAATDGATLPPATGAAQAPQPTTSTQPTTQGANDAPAPDSVAAGGTDGQVQNPAAASGEGAGTASQAQPAVDTIAQLEKYHADGVAYMASLRKERAQLDADIKKTEEALDRIVQEIDKARQAADLGGGNVFTQYLKAQQAGRDLRAAKIEAMRGVDLKSILPSKAKIDEVFKRRQEHGSKRPHFPARK